MLVKGLLRVQPIIFELFVQPADLLPQHSVIVVGYLAFINQLSELLLGNHNVPLGVSPKEQDLMDVFGNYVAPFHEKELTLFK